MEKYLNTRIKKCVAITIYKNSNDVACEVNDLVQSINNSGLNRFGKKTLTKYIAGVAKIVY